MKIYTKTGDAGDTGLFGGARVSKAHPRVEAYGAVDELNAQLGAVRAERLADDIDALLGRVQAELFSVGAELATAPGSKSSAKQWVSGAAIEALEHAIDEFEGELEPLQTFILPGGARGAALLHIARTVARRAERRGRWHPRRRRRGGTARGDSVSESTERPALRAHARV